GSGSRGGSHSARSRITPRGYPRTGSDRPARPSSRWAAGLAGLARRAQQPLGEAAALLRPRERAHRGRVEVDDYAPALGVHDLVVGRGDPEAIVGAGG